MPHKQVWVKVNAPVDEGVTELIEALSAFPKLETFASCQGGWKRSDADEEGGPATVCFKYGQHDHAHPWHDLADFVLGYLGPGLTRELGDLVSLKLLVPMEFHIFAELAVRQGAMRRTIKTIRQLRREFKNQPPNPMMDAAG